MKGHSRRHRARRPHATLARGALAAALISIAASLVMVLAGHPATDTSASAVADRGWSSTPPLDDRPGSADSADGADRGVVRGILRLRTDVPADPHTWVAYLIKGPTSMVRLAEEAPYRTDVDTRLLPDGRYTVDEVIFRPPSAPRVKTSRLRVDNRSSAVPSTPPPPPLPSPSPPTADPVPPPAAQRPVPVPVTAQPPLAATPTQLAPAAAPGADMAAQVVELSNAERGKAGCPPLAVDSRLTAAAQAHSSDMAAADYFSHDSRDGHTPFQRVAAAGYTFSVAAENIAAGQRTPQDVTTGWMNSPDHRANMLNCSLVHIGVGYATGGTYGTYWTQDFGTP